MKKNKPIRRRKRGSSGPIRRHAIKQLACECGTIMDVPDDTVSVRCPNCVLKENLKLYPPKWLTEPDKKEPKFKRPRGWHWLKLYVDPDGNVFRSGKECPKEKGKFKPTVVDQSKHTKAKKKKISKREKDRLYRKNMIEIGELNKTMKRLTNSLNNATTTKTKNKIKRQLKQYEIDLKKLKKERRKYL